MLARCAANAELVVNTKDVTVSGHPTTIALNVIHYATSVYTGCGRAVGSPDTFVSFVTGMFELVMSKKRKKFGKRQFAFERECSGLALVGVLSPCFLKPMAMA